MKFENTVVNNFQGAFRGLRNPLESWSKSDSRFGISELEYCDYDYEIAAYYIEANEKYDFDEEYDLWDEAIEKYAQWLRKNGVLRCDYDHNAIEYAYLGPKDLDLAHRMIKAGASDSKFLRQIKVCVDITAPLYWFKQFDTYKIGTTANSTSTMHKLSSTPITIDCFETDDYNRNLILSESNEKDAVISFAVDDFSKELIENLEKLRIKYNETKDQKYWKELIRWLPNGWLQTRTITMNYAVIRNIYFQRLHHRLSEWKQFCNWVETLPYSDDLITYTGKD